MAHEHHHCKSCSHEHHHEHEEHHDHHHEHAEGGLRRQLTLIILTVILLAGAVAVEHCCTLSTWQLLLVYLIPYLLIGHETLHEAWEGVEHGDFFNEHFLMAVATVGALCIGFLPGAETEFPEAVFVMLFFQVGELFEAYAEGKSRDSIAHLMDIRPDTATVERDGQTTTVSPDEVAVGETIVIRPGERVPLDGVVVEGASALNTTALTGESLPRDIAVGDEVVSGCVNLSGAIRVRTTKAFGESTVAKIISLVESAGEKKSSSEAFITRFARVYTPVVVVAALLLAVVPPTLSSAIYNLPFSESFSTWLYRALMFLVVSCPCALVISVPLTFFAGIGGASRRGILVKGASYMDVLAKVRTVVFDKTGTLTRGEFAVSAVHESVECRVDSAKDSVECRTESVEFATAIPSSENCAVANSTLYTLHSTLLHLAAHVEHYSTHPIGTALRDAFPNEASDGCLVSDVEEIAGHGIRAKVTLKSQIPARLKDACKARNLKSHEVCVGNTKMMDAIGARWHDCHHVGTIIHVAIDGEYAGHIVINDRIKDDSAEAVSGLRRLGVSRIVMLTGDRQAVAEQVASQLGIDEWHAELLPADKTKYVDAEANSAHNSTPNAVAFVGDGINDAPVLALADVGIAMGGLGSDAAIEAADVVIMDDHPSKVATAIAIARRTIAIARQNVAFAIAVKVAVLALATFGLGTMWMAVFADVGVTVLAVLNAMRALRI